MFSMSNPVWAILRADIYYRFRRTSTLIILLAVAAGVYLIVPDPFSGQAMMKVDNHRVIQNSAVVALATGLNCALLLSLFGYYLAGNSLRREIVSKTADVIAATRVTSTEYLTGKFFGNIAYLSGVGVACMASSMVMFLMRGEGPLQPFVFLITYGWLLFPMIVFVAAVSLLFESIPALSGRIGDVLYFFIWGGSLGAPVAIIENTGSHLWLGAIDIIGLTGVIEQLSACFKTKNISIGFSMTDPALARMTFPGLHFGLQNVAIRSAPILLGFIVILIARIFFHRFDPVKIKRLSGSRRWDLKQAIERPLKPVTRWLDLVLAGGKRKSGFFRTVWADVIITLMLSPLILVALFVFGALTTFGDLSMLHAGVLPAMVVVLVIALADIATRDAAAGMRSLLYTAPYLRSRYVVWKFCTAVVITLGFTAIPLVRLWGEPSPAFVSLLIGTMLLPAAAVGMGVMTGSGKLFIVSVLMLLDIALNAPKVPGLDFFGCGGIATAEAQVGYFGGVVLFIAAAAMRHIAVVRRL